MKEVTIMIADDERPAREFLKRLLGRIEGVSVVGEATDGEEALRMIRDLMPNLALLDLEMPMATGLEVARSLKSDEAPLIAFVTAYDQYAVDAFELNAVDYLLKPVDAERLMETIERARTRLGSLEWRAEQGERVAAASASYAANRAAVRLERVPIRHREEILLIPVAEIATVIADGELLNLSTADNRRYTINFRLKDIEARLDPAKFIRVSRSALINLDHLASATPVPGGTFALRMNNGQEVQASRARSKDLRLEILNL
ncbi:MAG TPA: LytTR family DNA-binding domain-containing protein [Pyrinomonadaceae bacterium]|nr:LytTR family DNA-binding domain-containing protein [Pyrinomonadaceae bacterium]